MVTALAHTELFISQTEASVGNTPMSNSQTSGTVLLLGHKRHSEKNLQETREGLTAARKEPARRTCRGRRTPHKHNLNREEEKQEKDVILQTTVG